MSRIKIDIPSHFLFRTPLTVRITDLNYGGHVGNDRFLTYCHEARVLFLQSMGYTELELGGVSLIMGDAALEYKKEVLANDQLEIAVTAANITRVSFDLIYVIYKWESNNWVPACIAKTGMVCFNYATRKVAALPEEVILKFSA